VLTRRRTRAALAAVGPTARVAYLGSTALTVGVAAVPVLVVASRPDPSMSAPLLLVCLVGGAALGWATDDPAADVLAPLPVSAATRTILRVLAVGIVAGAGVALAILVIALGPGLPSDRSARLAEAAAAGAVAVAVGLAAARRGERGVGPVGVTAGVLGTTLIAVLAHRWPTWLPTFGPGPTHARWWLVTALASAVAVRAGRDPARS
jgi:hypothetical protein